MPPPTKPMSVTAALAAATLVAAAHAADTNGPMSSTRPPAEAASAAQAEAPASAAATAPPTSASAAAPAASAPPPFNVPMLFANTCGWCHSNAGRVAGKGPQLMGTKLTDSEIVYRVKHGKPGAMPSFGGSFNDEQIKAIVAYIRDLKP